MGVREMKRREIDLEWRGETWCEWDQRTWVRGLEKTRTGKGEWRPTYSGQPVSWIQFTSVQFCFYLLVDPAA